MSDIQSGLFGRLAMHTGLVNEEQITECLEDQKKLAAEGGRVPRLGELLAAKGYLTVDQVRILLRKKAETRSSTRRKASVDPIGMKVLREYEEEDSTDSVYMADGEEQPEAGQDSDTTEDSATDSAETSSDKSSRITIDEKEHPFPAPSNQTQRREKQARFEDYRIIQRLGVDATGYTYKAIYLPEQSRVILHILSGSAMKDDSGYASTFANKVKVAYKLRHPGIQRINRGGKREGRYFYEAEYVAGRSLRRELRLKCRLDAIQTVKMAIEIAEALEYAHNKKVYHTELTPSSIIVSPEGNVKVSGLGMAGDPRGNIEWLAEELGDMPYYVAPELAIDEHTKDNIGPWTDLFSLGAILFHCLTGEPPFIGESLDEVLLSMYESESLEIRLSNGVPIPKSLRPILSKLLLPEINGRYRSAKSLIRDLKPLLAQFKRDEKSSAPTPPDRKGTAGFKPVTRKGGVIVQSASLPKGEGKLTRRMKLRKLVRANSNPMKNLAIAIGVIALIVFLIYGMVTSMSSGAKSQRKNIESRQNTTSPIKK